MPNLIRTINLNLSAGIFELVEKIYRLFYGLATTRLFNEEAIKTVTNNIYILVSIVILFAFAIKLIEAIVVPDMLTDSKKGVTGVLKRTLIGLLLIVAIPNLFNLAYYIQREIITSSLVEKLVLGHTDAESSPDSTAGVLTSTVIRGFVYPVDEDGTPITETTICSDPDNCNFANELVEQNHQYQEYVSILGAHPDYDDLGDLSIEVEWDNDEPIYHVDAYGLPLLLVGIYILYQVILLSMDAALRLVNLGILEIIAPIIIVAYIGGGNDYLTKWAKMVGEKFASIFVRIAALALMALGLQLMWSDSSVFNNNSTSFFFQLLVIIGLLRLIKDLPNIIGKIFGVDIKDPGGIKGRLGEMAGIGSLAQKAWTGLGNYTKGFAKSLGLATAGGIAGGIKKADRAFENKFDWSVGKKLRGIVNSKVGRGIKVFGAGVKSGGKNTGKALRESYDKEFKGEKRAAELKDKEAREKLLAKRAEADAPGIVEIDPDKGTEDFKKTIQNAKAAGMKVRDINSTAIANSSFKGPIEEELNKYNELMDDSNLANHKLDNKKSMLSTIDAMISATKSTRQKTELRQLKAKLASGEISNTYDLKTELLKLESTEAGGLDEKLIKNYFGEIENLGARAGAFENEFDLTEKAKVLSTKLEKQEKKVTELRETILPGDKQEEYDDITKKIKKRTDAEYAYERELDDTWVADYNYDAEERTIIERMNQMNTERKSRSSTTFTTEEKAEWDKLLADRAERRKERVEKAKNRLDELRTKMNGNINNLSVEEQAELNYIADKYKL